MFADKFSDSETAKKFSFGRNRCSYFVNFGIAPHFKTMLLHNVQKLPFFYVSFDEYLNKVLQNEQLDIQVRFWDENSVQAKTRYFDSQFSLRPNADNLLESLATAIKDL